MLTQLREFRSVLYMYHYLAWKIDTDNYKQAWYFVQGDYSLAKGTSMTNL